MFYRIITELKFQKDGIKILLINRRVLLYFNEYKKRFDPLLAKDMNFQVNTTFRN